MKGSLFINSKWQQGEGESLLSVCPVNQNTIWEGQQASDFQVNLAMHAAKKAFPLWSRLSLEKRISYLMDYKKLLERNKENLALLISKEVGKPLWESKTEVAGMIGKIDISIKAYHQRTPCHKKVGEPSEIQLTHRPHGVFVVLGPYNFPGHLPNGHIVPALLAGNTIVFKPSELTPMVAEAMIQLFEEANFPAGSINLVQGDKSVGQTLLDSNPNGVLFTGSYQTGKKIHAHFAGQVEVILALEMGGNNPLIICEVDDIDAAIYLTIMSAFITAGQRCTCARRLLIPNNEWGTVFLKALIKRVKALSNDFYDATSEPFMGPVISIEVSNTLLKKQEEWIALGANPLLRMQPGKGALISPGLIEVTSIRHFIEDEELFGPLLQVIRYDQFKNAIEIANSTKYGLSSGLISDNEKEKEHFYNDSKAGIVNINKQLTGASGQLPFGGVGCSGNHRASAYYSADFCAYPVATMRSKKIDQLGNMPSGMNWF